MPLPVQSIRAKAEHRDILQSVAEILRTEGDGELRRILSLRKDTSVGPFRSEDAALAFLRDRLVADLKPISIWFFGSRARGDAKPDSDFDVLVVLPDDRPGDDYSHQAVAKPVVACGVSCDIVPTSQSDFLREKDEVGSFVNRIVSEGREIYRRRPQRFADAA